MKKCSNCGFVSLSKLEGKILEKLKKGSFAEKDLAKSCGVSLTAIYYSTKNLEKAGLVKTKKEAAKHGLKKVVWLSETQKKK